ncbi:hypothetical protein BS47DRAFT_24250 [Hydnum rufescens UP504]|uniref:BTB domain-containing protein n=1 Tax=Hydnum rufescens UP504 TaxID=1448309 RepID=A0A9P6E1D7_9AGAM|nr:hypothetical protein BS47DRAFT_24250 [Hydnum rufescens UP504]
MIQRSFDAADPSYPSQYLGGQSIGSVWGMHNVSPPLHPHIRLPPPYDLHQDTILCSSDGVFFHVHRQQLAASVNSFASLLIDPTVHTIILQESSPVVNCFLSLVYGFSCRPYSPSFGVISEAFDAVLKYGFSLPVLVPPESELFQDLLHAADSHPLRVYTLAAHHSYEALAVAASAKTLSMNINEVTESIASEMGSPYLLRLTHLHSDRKETFKELMHVAPDSHPQSPGCTPERQSSAMRAYALAAAYLVWQATPDVGNEWIVSNLSPLLERIDCPLCKQNVRRRIDVVLEAWARVRCTI